MKACAMLNNNITISCTTHKAHTLLSEAVSADRVIVLIRNYAAVVEEIGISFLLWISSLNQKWILCSVAQLHPAPF